MTSTNVDTAQDVVIDAHCHVFNASDLSVSGFLRRVVVDSDEHKVKKVLDPLVRLLAKLVRGAPSADDEIRQLDGKNPMSVTLESFAAMPGALEEDGTRDREFALDLETEVKRLAASADAGDRELLRMIAEEEAEAPLAPPSYSLAADTAPLVGGLLSGIGTIGRYVTWVRLMKRYRWEILQRLIRTYGEQRGSVQLFTPALVDYGRWLDDPPESSLPSQYVVMSRLARLFAPRMLPLAAFDPWRESECPGGEDGSLAWVQRAVREMGFIGVKLYPPMGYAPLGNANLDFRLVGHPEKEFGERLDAAMRSLFQWAVSEDVPIMAHASDSMESRHEYGRRAGPDGWRKALQEFGDLRVNLAHFGGETALSGLQGWPEQFAGIARDYPNVYMDLGHFDDVLSSRAPSLWTNLVALINKYPVLKARLMYGSDWSMLARVKSADQYFDRVRSGLEAKLGSQVASDILGRNAVRFYALADAEANAVRVRRYYERNGLPPPMWLGEPPTA